MPSTPSNLVSLLHQEVKTESFTSPLMSLPSASRMEEGWKAASIQYYVDFCGLEDRKITIRGWILDLTGENNLSITDENGNEVPGALKRSFRPDVAENTGLESVVPENTEAGFAFSYPRSEFQGKSWSSI